MGKNHAASYYESLTRCRMGETEIAELCASDIDLFEDQLREALPFWDTYHELAQQALFDMAYNLGVAGLMKFPKMLFAVDEGDWETAAVESRRNGIPDERNEEIAALYLSCGS
jgi:GH24 family phage-related lysozyme (muramidase)